MFEYNDERDRGDLNGHIIQDGPSASMSVGSRYKYYEHIHTSMVDVFREASLYIYRRAYQFGGVINESTAAYIKSRTIWLRWAIVWPRPRLLSFPVLCERISIYEPQRE